MPTIKTLRGCKLAIYYRDHQPPHVHVNGPGFSAKMRIDSGEIIAGSLPARAARNARRWIARNRAFVEARWRAIAEME